MLLAALAAAAVALPSDLAAAAHAYDEAQVHGDRAALERLVADDYVLVSSSGQVQAKGELIAGYTDPGFKLDPFTVRQPVEQVWGDGAVLGGVVDYKGVDGGKPFNMPLRFADVWAKRGGTWRVIYTQVSRVAAP